MEQLALLVSTAHGEQVAASLQVRLHAHTTDPPTAKAAAQSMVRTGRLARQAEWVYDVIATHGPGTPWELAHRAWASGTTLGLATVTELYYAIERCRNDLLGVKRIRVVEKRACTVKVGGRVYQVLAAVREEI